MVLGQHVGLEVGEPAVAGQRGEVLEQQRADAVTAGVVGDQEGDLAVVSSIGSAVPSPTSSPRPRRRAPGCAARRARGRRTGGRRAATARRSACGSPRPRPARGGRAVPRRRRRRSWRTTATVPSARRTSASRERRPVMPVGLAGRAAHDRHGARARGGALPGSWSRAADCGTHPGRDSRRPAARRPSPPRSARAPRRRAAGSSRTSTSGNFSPQPTRASETVSRTCVELVLLEVLGQAAARPVPPHVHHVQGDPSPGGLLEGVAQGELGEGRPVDADHDPARAGGSGGLGRPRTTTTGQSACVTTCWATEPRTAPTAAPWPLRPRTTVSAPRTGRRERPRGTRDRRPT